MRDYFSEGVDLLEDCHFAMDRGDKQACVDITLQLAALNVMKDFDERLAGQLMEAFRG